MTTCIEPIAGSVVDPRLYPNGGGSGWDHYVQMPCGLTTTRSCPVCDKPICRWHLVSKHDHSPAKNRKVRGSRRR